MSRLGSAGLQDLINQLTKDRESQLGKIESLFTNFGVSAKADVGEAFTKRRGARSQDLISRGLSSTTRAVTAQDELVGQEQRELGRISEQVAGQKAGFLERQLVGPGLIAQLITQASSVDTGKTNVQVGASNVGAPTFGQRPGVGGAGGGGGGGSASLPNPSNFTRGGSSTGGSGARIIRGGSGPTTGGASTSARTVTNTPSAPSTGGTGSITDLATGKTTTSAQASQGAGTGSITDLSTGKTTTVGGASAAATPKKTDDGVIEMSAKEFRRRFPNGIPRGSNTRVRIV